MCCPLCWIVCSLHLQRKTGLLNFIYWFQTTDPSLVIGDYLYSTFIMGEEVFTETGTNETALVYSLLRISELALNRPIMLLLFGGKENATLGQEDMAPGRSLTSKEHISMTSWVQLSLPLPGSLGWQMSNITRVLWRDNRAGFFKRSRTSYLHRA